MNVKELIAELQKVDGGLEVRVRAEKVQVTIGCSPSVLIENVSCGFDWDSGTLFLNPAKCDYLVQLDREEYQHIYELKSLTCSLAGRKYALEAVQNFVHKDKLLEKAVNSGYSEEVVNQIKKLMEGK